MKTHEIQKYNCKPVFMDGKLYLVFKSGFEAEKLQINSGSLVCFDGYMNAWEIDLER
jgi:hypothetical protein